MNNRIEKKYNKLVAQKDNEFFFCDDIFEYKDVSLKGATGTILRPVSKEEYEQRTSSDGLYDNLGELWQQAVEAGNTELGKQEWCDQVFSIDGDEAIFDLSGYNLWDQLRAIGYTEDEYPIFECTGGGRCFGRHDNYDKVYDQELLDKIKAIEAE